MTGADVDARIVVTREGFQLDVSITAAAGEVVAIMGPSGAGKSTLLGAVAGLVRPTGGHINIAGRTVDDAEHPRSHVAPMHRGVVLLGQEPRLFPHLTARENIVFALRSRGTATAAARGVAHGWLQRVGVPDAAARRPSDLSGGQQQRVAIARALAAAPSVVLLDEPLTSLDAETAADIRTILAAQLSTSGTTAILVTHDVVDAAALASRLMILEEGSVTQVGRTRDVLSQPATQFAAAVAGLNRMVGIAHQGGWSQADRGLGLRATDAASQAAAASDGADLVAVFAPSAVRLRPIEHAGASKDYWLDRDMNAQPHGWTATVLRLEPSPGGVLVRAEIADGTRSARALETHGGTVTAELPAAAASALALAPGALVHMSVEPDDVRLFAARTSPFN